MSRYATSSVFQSLLGLQTPCTLTCKASSYLSLLSARWKAVLWMRKVHTTSCTCIDKLSVTLFPSLFCVIISCLSHHERWIFSLINTPEKANCLSLSLGAVTTCSLQALKLLWQKGELFILLSRLSFQIIWLPVFCFVIYNQLLFLQRVKKMGRGRKKKIRAGWNCSGFFPFAEIPDTA